MKVNWKERCLSSETSTRMALRELQSLEVVFRVGSIVFLFVIFCWVGSVVYATSKINELQVPILQSYPVYINRKDPMSEGALNYAIFKLNECQDSWREDERTIKKLKGRN